MSNENRGTVTDPTTGKQYDEGVMVWLDKLRESGECNMMEGPSRLLNAGMCETRREAREVFFCWTQTFASRHPELGR